MFYDFTEKRIVITGITGAIAQATTQLLSSLGAEVIVTARSHEKLEQSLADLSDKVSGGVLDLTDEESIKAFFEKTGNFDHLVTTAASSMLATLKEMNFKAAKELIATKLWGQMLCVYHSLPYLSKTGSVTLFSGTVSQKPIAGASMFAAAGGGSEAAGRVWAYELAPIRVNSIVPGIIDTRLWEDITGNKDAAQAQLDNIAKILPVQRVGRPEEIAKAVAFLIDNGFVNGTSLVVDGGHRLV